MVASRGLVDMEFSGAWIWLNHGFARDGEVLFLCLSKDKVPKKKVEGARGRLLPRCV